MIAHFANNLSFQEVSLDLLINKLTLKRQETLWWQLLMKNYLFYNQILCVRMYKKITSADIQEKKKGTSCLCISNSSTMNRMQYKVNS